MKLAATRDLYDYWNSLRGSRPAPARREVEPGDIRHLLGMTFLLEAVDSRTYPYRLAGSQVCSAYCGELKGSNFLSPWTGKDRQSMVSLLAAIRSEGAAAVAGVELRTECGRQANFEVLLLPLTGDEGEFTRILGSMANDKQPYWIGTYPIVGQSLTGLRLLWPGERPFFMRPAKPHNSATTDLDPGGRRQVAHLTVYDGGRT